MAFFCNEYGFLELIRELIGLVYRFVAVNFSADKSYNVALETNLITLKKMNTMQYMMMSIFCMIVCASLKWI